MADNMTPEQAIEILNRHRGYTPMLDKALDLAIAALRERGVTSRIYESLEQWLEIDLNGFDGWPPFDELAPVIKARIDTLAAQQVVTGPTGEGLAGFAKDLPGEGPEYQPTDAELIAWVDYCCGGNPCEYEFRRDYDGDSLHYFDTSGGEDIHHVLPTPGLVVLTLTPAARAVLTPAFLAWRKETTDED